jgi:peptidoglycan/xylan/chitin deacetylase (PgdA/CDA1 family)
MTGTTIISLDCEGRWGVADHLTPEAAAGLTDARLKDAYQEIIDLFEDAELAATFAFVELFTRPASSETTQLVRHLAEELPYLSAAAHGLATGEEGWVGAWALEMANTGRHEIAFHGATHVPWTDLSADQARRELDLTPPAHRQTMVFPRNRIAHLDVLAEFGCRAFRGCRDFPSRAQSLLSEFDLSTPSQAMPRERDGMPVEIPSGIFVNWRSGLRRLVPPAVTRRRARNLLDHASRTGGVAHFWLHPENVATAPATFQNLTAIVEEIVRFRDAGKIRVETQLSALGGS